MQQQQQTEGQQAEGQQAVLNRTSVSVGQKRPHDDEREGGPRAEACARRRAGGMAARALARAAATHCGR